MTEHAPMTTRRPATSGPSEVAIVATGTANLAAVEAAFRRIGVTPRVTTDAEEIGGVDHLVLPGVGAFRAAREALGPGISEALAARIREGRPTLGVCLGLHLMCEESEESPGVAGLGVVGGRVGRFGEGARVPQMGWNRVDPEPGVRLVRAGYAYFANSYRLTEAPAGWRIAWAEHDGRFVASIERGAVLACQFHPELSGGFGREILRRWLEAAPC